MRTLKAAIANERKARGMSLRELSKATDVPHLQIHRAEKGITNCISFESAMKLFGFLNIDPWSIKL